MVELRNLQRGVLCAAAEHLAADMPMEIPTCPEAGCGRKFCSQRQADGRKVICPFHRPDGSLQ